MYFKNLTNLMTLIKLYYIQSFFCHALKDFSKAQYKTYLYDFKPRSVSTVCLNDPLTIAKSLKNIRAK